MSARCTKAIIAVAGFGTRWLPLTKAIEKCMLPIGNRPVIDYVVEDCIKAGIKDIYFVVGEQSEQLRRFYGTNDLLEKHLRQKGKTAELERLEKIRTQARFHFVVQGPDMPYGTAVPVMLCERFVKPGEQVIVLMGDQFTWRKDGKSEVGHLLSEVKAAGVTAGMVVAPVPKSEVHKYGIVEVEQHRHKRFFTRIVEKPSPKEAPTNLNNLSMYVFDEAMFGCLQHVKPTKGEYYVTDALNVYVRDLQRQLAVVTAQGEYLDSGNVDGWLHANQFIARHS
jgi:UTP--glucose-1-phosphate uridylyltransferase